MVLTQISPERLRDFCSPEHLELLDAIDSLRSQGLDRYVSLPQIIVCGDQSSGKSSVLEAISGVSFPVKSSLCTRFPTELILRKSSQVSARVSIVPHHSRSEDEKASLHGFRENLASFQELPDLIESAKIAMGIATRGKAFSRDLLRVEISGPDRPHLTIVDLPGLVHSETKHQSSSDIDLTKDIVGDYMLEKRTIILAVVSAKNDVANQIVLKLARDADPEGNRTLGIITKPDVLAAESDSEATYISLASNKDVEFTHGWHVVRNRDTDTESWSLEQRDWHETDFFNKGAWSALPSARLGIKPLRVRLSNLLLRQITSELPSLMNEISVKVDICRSDIKALGEPRISLKEQMRYLTQISDAFRSLTQAAVGGAYNDGFFGDPMSSLGYEKRIRAVVQNLNRDFAVEIAENGRKYMAVEFPSDSVRKSKTTLMSREDLITRVVPMIQRTRGLELPNTFSPAVVTDLFEEQSMPWSLITQKHVERVWRAVKLFLTHLVTHISNSVTATAIMETVVSPKLDALLAGLRKKTADILQPHQTGHPITYNADFINTLADLRVRRQLHHTELILQEHFPKASLNKSCTVNVEVNFPTLVRGLLERIELDATRWAASEVIDAADAYYQVALKRFIDDVSVQVIETGLMTEIGHIFSPTVVIDMSEEDTAAIAGEGERTLKKRKELDTKLKLLISGTETCKRFSGLKIEDTIFEESYPGLPAMLSDSEQGLDGAGKKKKKKAQN